MIIATIMTERDPWIDLDGQAYHRVGLTYEVGDIDSERLCKLLYPKFNAKDCVRSYALDRSHALIKKARQ